MTLEVQALIKKCDSVLFLVNDPAMKKWIIDNSVKSLSLDSVYFGCQERKDSYKFICQEIIKSARTHRNTCFVTYGNPMFLSNASQQLIEDIGVMPDIQIKILPGISSLDTLFWVLSQNQMKAKRGWASDAVMQLTHKTVQKQSH